MSAPWEAPSNFDTQERQVSISEWTYRDKLETLFVFQLLFLGLVVTCLFAALSKLGFFQPALVYVVGGAVVVVVTLVWFFRLSYTKGTRDKYAWDRRYFSGDFSKDPAVPLSEVAAAAKAAIAACQAKKAAAIAAGTVGASGIQC
jgi:hypothetical protein